MLCIARNIKHKLMEVGLPLWVTQYSKKSLGMKILPFIVLLNFPGQQVRGERFLLVQECARAHFIIASCAAACISATLFGSVFVYNSAIAIRTKTLLWWIIWQLACNEALEKGKPTSTIHLTHVWLIMYLQSWHFNFKPEAKLQHCWILCH